VNRQYAGAKQELGSDYARGVSFSLETSWGKLCEEADNQEACFSCIWGGLHSNVGAQGKTWAQAGTFDGHIGTVQVDTVVYIEVFPHPELGSTKPLFYRATAGYLDFHYSIDITPDNVVLDIEFEFTSSDSLILRLNGQRLEKWRNSYVDPAKMKAIKFYGEITHYESDMAGTEADSCWFGDCQYLGSNWTWQPAVLDTLVSNATDSSQWGAEVVSGWGGDSVAIWDKHRR
jgi:hypothetical protein